MIIEGEKQEMATSLNMQHNNSQGEGDIIYRAPFIKITTICDLQILP